MKIDDLVNTIGAAVFEAHKSIENHSVVYFFQNYFDKKETDDYMEAYQPKTIEVEIPGNKDGRVLYIPIAALVSHSHLNIESLKLNLDINIMENGDNSLGIFAQTSDDAGKKAGEMEIIFKCEDAAEGVARIETQLNSLL